MTTKPVWFTGHAQDRLKEYAITRPTVRRILATRDRVSIGGGYFKVAGRARCRVAAKMRDREVLVSYHEDAERILVVTVMAILTPHELDQLRRYREQHRRQNG
jgi:hypothetical protein